MMINLRRKAIVPFVFCFFFSSIINFLVHFLQCSAETKRIDVCVNTNWSWPSHRNPQRVLALLSRNEKNSVWSLLHAACSGSGGWETAAVVEMTGCQPFCQSPRGPVTLLLDSKAKLKPVLSGFISGETEFKSFKCLLTQSFCVGGNMMLRFKKSSLHGQMFV